MTAFVKKHSLIITNILLAVFTSVTMFVKAEWFENDNVFVYIVMYIRETWLIAVAEMLILWWLRISLCAVLSVFAYKKIIGNDAVTGIVLSAFGGFIGGFAAVLKNKSFIYSTAVKIIFSIYMWFFSIIPITAVLLMTGYYQWI